MKSYGDSLRLFNEAADLINRAAKERESWKHLCREALTRILQALILLKGGGYRPESDLTFLAAQALEVGAINEELYALVVKANLIINGYLSGGLEDVLSVAYALMRRAASIDAYLNQQMSLYRY